MKTLKQHLNKKADMNYKPIPNEKLLFISQAQQAVKEWLQEHKNNLNKKGFDYPISAPTIQKLIEELEK